MRARPLATIFAVSTLLLGIAAPGHAEDATPAEKAAPKEGKAVEDYKLALTGRVEPADLGPGRTGTYVVTLELRDKLHVLKDNLSVKPVETPGVVYGEVELPELHTFENEWGDKVEEWKKDIDIRVHVEVAKDAAPETRLGLEVTYMACSDVTCGPQYKSRVFLTLGEKAGPTISSPVGDSGAVVSLTIDEEKGEAVVRFEPKFGFHVYGTSINIGEPIEVHPQAVDGVTWGEFEIPSEAKIHEPVEIRIPFTREDDAKEVSVKTKHAACSQFCLEPFEGQLRAVWGEDPVLVEDVIEENLAERGDLEFAVVETDEFVGEKAKDSQYISDLVRDKGLLLALGVVFVIGLGLALTPCVLPVIPMMVAAIGGGGNIPKGRLARLLLTYVAGLSLAYGSIGLVSAFTGSQVSAIFDQPAVQWGMVIFFTVMALGMLGIIEFQPPQWLMRLQGSAQSKGGSYIGALLLGVMGAILASPCTGPVIAGMVVFTANTGDALTGFTLFTTLGLGVGAVFFAFGSLNFALRPGPWMVWVRYAFGVLLFAGAMYYVALNGLMPFEVFLAVGIAIALLAGFLLARHLIHKLREDPKKAWSHAGWVSGLFLVALGVVAYLNRPTDRKVEWTYITSRAELLEEVGRAAEAGKPVVVDFWATNCYYCKEYDKLFARDDDLYQKFQQIAALKVDLTGGEKPDIRGALGVPPSQRPFIVFIDTGDGEPTIRRNADVGEWLKPDPADQIRARLNLILAESGTKAASEGGTAGATTN